MLTTYIYPYRNVLLPAICATFAQTLAIPTQKLVEDFSLSMLSSVKRIKQMSRKLFMALVIFSLSNIFGIDHINLNHHNK